jgi:hypothetical protein
MTLGNKDLKALWRDQDTETQPMSIELIHARAFQSRVKVRNVIEYAACVAVIAIFIGYALFLSGPLIKLGSVMIALGAAFTSLQLHRRGSARDLPPGASAASSLTFHRAELVRQRDAIGSAAWWYIAPFVPGMAVFMAGLAQAMPGNSLANLAPLGVAIGGYLVFWTLMNRGATRRLRKEIAEIDELMRG